MAVAPIADERIPVAFVGSVLPDELIESNVAFSQAGQLFQERLIGSLLGAGLGVDEAFVQQPVASYPRDRRIWFPRRSADAMEHRLRVVAVAFVNLGPLKTLTVAIGTFLSLLHWGWRHRRAPHRVIMPYNVSAPPGIVSVLAGAIVRAAVIPVIADIQVPGSGLVPRTLFRRIEYWLQTVTLPLCDGLVVLTRAMAEDFAPTVPYIQMEGAVPDELAEAPDAGAGTSDEDGGSASHATAPIRSDLDDLIVMYAGGLSVLKGTRVLLDAMHRLTDPRIRLWITGDGPLREEVERAARSDPRITYWGFAPYARVTELLKRATVLVNPHTRSLGSARYVFPSKLIEYLATGVPVISTVSTPEVIEEYGDVILPTEADSPDALAKTIASAAAEPRAHLRALGARAREHVARSKSWSAQGRRIAGFVRERLRA